MASEFDLIARYFDRPAAHAVLGVGDDAALIRPGPGLDLAVSADMLVAGRHFFPDADPAQLGHKALAVNLSDLAAMAATPRWALLSVALPEADEAWLAGFARGFFGLAERYGVDLVGGDTTRGPLNLSVTILGEVPAGQALRRDGARVGDDLWVSGELGGAALGLRHLQGQLRLAEAEAAACLERLHAPEPRVALGRALAGLANSAIDVSDGLLGDLGHILERSRLGAEIELAALPVPAVLAARLPAPLALACLLAGGDDYELCFSAPPGRRAAVQAAAHSVGVAVSRIGHIGAEPGLRVRRPDGGLLDMEVTGFDHFA
ncbi:thiamine-phosphate kinase [Parasulfuritortus cantonensis]|uniref:Thiamine-monophosphate kinase n=1 Tax=Parasulfuritortus cantonensis TaxID=2528202 RepID=A0A4R1BSF8_9PROT|nr:thiamine-phosphate kinase [Parasulfuritortus cantonensis]TCJ20226.1 thiamine-phosphate kinase [Parasulfuritortus cantonensis]